MRWEKYRVPLLELGLIVTGAVAIISLASVFILNARLRNIQTEQTVVRETSAVEERSALEQQLMVYGSSDARALVMTNSLPMQGLAGEDLVCSEAEDVCAASDADGRYYVWRMSDGELLTTYTNTSYDRALLIGQNRILLEDSGNFYCFDYTSGMQLWKWQFPQLKARFGRNKGLLLGGVIWGAWHWPLIWLIGYEYGAYTGNTAGYRGFPVSGMLLFCLVAIGWGILHDRLYENSGSIWVPSLFHGAINAAAALPLSLCLTDTGSARLLGPQPMGIVAFLPFIAAAVYVMLQKKRKADVQ